VQIWRLWSNQRARLRRASSDCGKDAWMQIGWKASVNCKREQEFLLRKVDPLSSSKRKRIALRYFTAASNKNMNQRRKDGGKE